MVRVKLWEQGDQIARLIASMTDGCELVPKERHADIAAYDCAAGIFLPGCPIVLLNADCPGVSLSCAGSLVITYGLEARNTVTFSSVDEQPDGLTFCYCLQRAIQTADGHTIDGMDIPVHITGEQVGVHQGMCAVTIALLSGMTPDGELSFSISSQPPVPAPSGSLH